MSLPMHDFDGLNRAALAACPDLLFRLLPGGRRFGHEFKAGSLAGEKGDSLSINLHTGRWADFATGETGGDLIDLLAKKDRLSLGDARRALAEMVGMGDDAPVRPAAEVIHLAPRDPEWVAVMPAPAEAPEPPTTHPKFGQPEHTARVLNQAGELMHLIMRFPPAGDRDRKMIAPLTYGTLVLRGKQVTGWHWKAPPPPRPLYGLPLQDDAPVLVVEGEVKRDAAARLLPGWSVVSWPGGAQAIGKADWSPLRGREVVMWPDADQPGAEAAAAVVNVLRGIAAEVRAVTPPEGKDGGWDLADAEREGWTGSDVLNHIAPLDPDERDEPREDPRDEEDSMPFRCLGHDRGLYYFLPQGAGQVVALSARDCHNDASLAVLAPRRWWEGAYPGRTTFDLKAAGDALIQSCHRVGIFDPDRQRGRGVWLDEGRTVVHLGDRLLCDGEEFPPAAFPSRFVYEAARPLNAVPTEPLTDREAAGLLRLCCEVAWDQPERDGRLVAGWAVAAMICGALPWRPHLWVVSESGKGKSWVEDNILRPLLGDLALRVQGKTTEPAIRRALRIDARPVLFDEAETQNRQDAERMQQVIDLSRAASAENGADILKADMGKGSGVVRYSIRSCFYFSAINLAISQAADESRAIVATLTLPEDKELAAAQFASLKAVHAEVMVPGFGNRLLARCLGLVPTIRHNAEVLASAIARNGVSRRTGDTLGVVLACAYSLTSTARLDADSAAAFLGARSWVGSAAKERENDPEWKRALMRLMQYELRFTSGNGRPEVATIAELVSACRAMDPERGVPAQTADLVLRRHGIRLMEGGLRIFGHSELAKRAFAETSWAGGWAATLARAPGARRNVNTRYVEMIGGKSVVIPLDAISGSAT
jgi:putative DNA primase/helicase